MASKGSFSSTIGWNGSKGTNCVSIKLGHASGSGWGSGGPPAPNYGAGKPMPVMAIPKGNGLGNK
jgi:hypothetical protein